LTPGAARAFCMFCFQWPARALFGTDHFDETRNPATMAHLLGRLILRLDPTDHGSQTAKSGAKSRIA
jgi:hypothetical protein